MSLSIESKLATDRADFNVTLVETDTETLKTATYVVSVVAKDQHESQSQTVSEEETVASLTTWIANFNTNRTVVERKRSALPLRAKVYDLSPTGNLTIIFSKPLILPPIKVIAIANKTKRELSTP